MISNTPNPHLKQYEHSNIEKIVKHYIHEYLLSKSKNENILMLDIGGGRGFGQTFSRMSNVEYFCLDLNLQKNTEGITYIQGDITDSNLNINKEFDIIITKDTFEHILNPWDATNNILKLIKNGGVFMCFVPFSWRYHASPYDTYRYSHTGLQYLFERNNGMKKIQSGYMRFRNIQGFWKNKKDFTMNHPKPFTECIEAVYIGKRDVTHKFDINDLDKDISNNHSE